MEYIMYIDESHDKDGKYIVLSGYIIPTSRWRHIDRHIKGLKEKFFGDRNINLKRIRRHKYLDKKKEKPSPWCLLTDEQKADFDKWFWSVVGDSEYYCVIAALIEKEKMEAKGDRELYFQLAYSFIIQRYQYFLQDKKSRGMVIMDKADGFRDIEQLEELHREILEKGVVYNTKMSDPIPITMPDGTIVRNISIKEPQRHNVTLIYENLIFQDDNNSNLLQTADFVCAAIASKYNGRTSYYFDCRVQPLVRKKAGTDQMRGYGLKFFPQESIEKHAAAGSHSDTATNPEAQVKPAHSG